MIRNVVIHLMNEQPLLADVEALPLPSDVAFVCTNVRTMNGTRPVFIDRMESVFVFPYAQIRFIEVPDAARAGEADAPRDSSGRRQERDTRPAEKPYNGGHYRNLMNASYDRVGLGVWVAGGRVRLVIDFYHPR